jgi:hypothetical protein
MSHHKLSNQYLDKNRFLPENIISSKKPLKISSKKPEIEQTCSVVAATT